MRTLLAALLVFVATPALAVPFCHAPRGGSAIVLQFEIGDLSETDRAKFYEQRLRARGIDAADTRLWNGCIQTFVTENGRFTMRFFDPWTLEEIPVN